MNKKKKLNEIIIKLHHGKSHKEALRCARALEAHEEAPKGTGERRLSHPMMREPVTQHHKRDAIRPLVTWLRRLALLLLQSLGG